MNPFTILQDLPCDTCHADCCGPVPLTSTQYRRAVKHLASIAPAELQRLSKLKRKALNCCFLGRNRCSIYEVRPALCRVFGRSSHPMLVCPHAPERSKELPASEVNAMMTIDAQQSKHIPSWSEVLQDIRKLKSEAA